MYFFQLQILWYDIDYFKLPVVDAFDSLALYSVLDYFKLVVTFKFVDLSNLLMLLFIPRRLVCLVSFQTDRRVDLFQTLLCA